MKIICAIEKFVVPLHPISRQTKMAAETIASLAQLVEHSICNQAVVGSSPTRGSLPPQQSGRTDCTTRNKAIDASAFKTITFCVVFVLERRGKRDGEREFIELMIQTRVCSRVAKWGRL